MTAENREQHAARVVAHLPDHLRDALELANESGELFPCAEYGHHDCAISPNGRCMDEEWGAMQTLERVAGAS